MNIVAATDFSTRSNRALRKAGLSARSLDAKLHLVHVVDDDQPKELVRIEEREAQRVLVEQIVSMPELQNVQCYPTVVKGHPFDGILRAAAAADADLVVMGAHRKQFLRDIFTGTTIERVIRGGRYPVLMVNNEAQRRYERALVPVDMSDTSADAIRVGLSTGLLAEGTILHAFSPMAKTRLLSSGASGAVISGYVDSERQKAMEELTKFLVTNKLGTQRWFLQVAEGGPMQVITRAVSERRPDMLVMGTHGRSGMLRALIGSVTEEVLRSLNVDVLVVPPGGSERTIANPPIAPAPKA
ncbi:universal stress protein E [Bradyrhizobium sp. JR7.2]|uniref:universal stress protein n=1 Tax=Bradyrhizobium TaxID=374 RepID=UPI0007C1DDE9|nr:MULTISPECIES: universal stress protein [unclassified Bradyrhizobium]TFW56880.1 universal stress protein [Bradyrhizobium sp. MOS001]CUU20948.1 Universal stress protein Usp CDS [Bradyrhizobium sp.]